MNASANAMRSHSVLRRAAAWRSKKSVATLRAPHATEAACSIPVRAGRLLCAAARSVTQRTKS
jgi:hypothetical protein